jgi:hypothetical protein
MVVDAREQHRAARRARRGGMKIRELHTSSHKPIEMGRIDFGAIGSQITKTEIIRDNE